MDAIELGRQAAARLHAEAVARGADPWNPFAFAEAEAQRRGIQVESTAPGSVMLDGGRATFLPEEPLILYEDRGTAFDRAFLIAHELGHVELGDDLGPSQVMNIDPARPADAAPVGFERVIDYSRRQRREVQMDLFAREFLLPRSVVRQLHLEQNLTASEVAQRLGAPFDVVAQQFLDALLLPEIPVVEEPARAEHPLNGLQAVAARHRGGAYLLEAGPGTGKTQTLVTRIEGLLDEGVDPRRILMLTFSNKAAGEMAERIAARRPEAAASLWIGTFHAFGLDVVRRFHEKFGLPLNPRLMDRTEAVELLEDEFPRLELVHYRNIYDPTQVIVDILSAISRAKDEVVDATRYGELADAMRARALSEDEIVAAGKAAEVAQVYELYERLKRTRASVDFGDLVSLPVQLLEGDSATREHFRTTYDHVLVDEYQDVNRSSVRLLRALRDDGTNLWAVGDAKQSIYRFRGASAFNMARFDTVDFPGGLRGRLEANYRSVGEIVDAFSAFAAGMSAIGTRGKLEADRPPCGVFPEVLTAPKSEPAVVALADQIGSQRAAGYPFRAQAVLCRGNEHLSELGQHLERLGVPVLFLGSLFERPEVKDLAAVLSLFVDRRATGLLRVACWPGFEMPLADVAAVITHLREGEGTADAWRQQIDTLPGLSQQGRRSLHKLAAVLEGFDASSSPWEVLSTLLLDRTRFAAEIAQSTQVETRARGIALWQFLNFVRMQPAGAGLPIYRLLDRIRRLVRLGDERDLRQLPAAAQSIDAVRLMTIHGAKGLEFEVVHVHGMNQDSMPGAVKTPPCLPPDGMIEGAEGPALEVFRDGQMQELQCLFYVALSRAKERLFLYAATQKANGHARALSAFLDRLGTGVQRRTVATSRALPPSPADGAIELVIPGGVHFTNHQLGLYESCPRRFFYTHILRGGGRRTSTPYTSMHEAVRAVVTSITAGNTPISELERQLDAAFAAQGLVEHGYANLYRPIALRMLRFFQGTHEGGKTTGAGSLSLSFEQDVVLVQPDESFVDAHGRHKLRRVETHHRRSGDGDDLSTASFVLAVRQTHPAAIVEIVSLSDESAETIELTDRVLGNRREKLTQVLQFIRKGHFPAKPQFKVCPRCPAFFSCGAVPSGAITIAGDN